MRPFATPSENSSGSRVSMPGTPFGTLLKCGVRAARASCLPALEAEGAWSDENTWNTPSARPCQITCWLRLVARRRAQMHLAPSKPRSARSSGQEQILRAGLAIDLQPAALRPADLLHRFAPRDVHDQHRHVDELGQRDRPVRRLALDQHGRHFGGNCGAVSPAARAARSARGCNLFSAWIITIAPLRRAVASTSRICRSLSFMPS